MTGRPFAYSFALSVVFAAFSAAPAPAQPSYYAPCMAADLKGVWELGSISADEPGVEAFYRAHPVEYMRFKPGGDYIYVARNAKLPDLAAVNASLDRADRADGVTYRATIDDDQGTLTIRRNGVPFQRFRCIIQDHLMIWHEAPGMPKLNRLHRPVR